MFPEPRFVATNDLQMAVYEQGQGPAVIFLHGFPELAYSWRHQLPALAEAGFRAIAPDLRGYGRTGGPDEVEAYAVGHLIADVEGLMDALDIETATIVGHDWGALLMWHFAMRLPHRVDRLVGLNIPHTPRPPIDPVAMFRQRFGADFYIVNFQDSDEADRAFAANPRKFFTNLVRKNQLPRAMYDQLPDEMKVLSLLNVMEREDPGGELILNEEELDYFVNAFARSGFTKPINWYRNWSRNWAAFEGIDQSIAVPTLFIAAADELVVGPEQVEGMRALVPNLTVHTLKPCGHWSQQERPDDVNRLVVEWLVERG
jgi:pimeloyl-ACP methyl ester carboxylesterase